MHITENEIDGEALKLLKDPSVLDDMQIPKQVGQRLKFWQVETKFCGRKFQFSSLVPADLEES